eukprot:2144944-Rhodomonas_salina.1
MAMRSRVNRAREWEQHQLMESLTTHSHTEQKKLQIPEEEGPKEGETGREIEFRVSFPSFSLVRLRVVRVSTAVASRPNR